MKVPAVERSCALIFVQLVNCFRNEDDVTLAFRPAARAGGAIVTPRCRPRNMPGYWPAAERCDSGLGVA